MQTNSIINRIRSYKAPANPQLRDDITAESLQIIRKQQQK